MLSVRRKNCLTLSTGRTSTSHPAKQSRGCFSIVQVFCLPGNITELFVCCFFPLLLACSAAVMQISKRCRYPALLRSPSLCGRARVLRRTNSHVPSFFHHDQRLPQAESRIERRADPTRNTSHPLEALQHHWHRERNVQQDFARGSLFFEAVL